MKLSPSFSLTALALGCTLLGTGCAVPSSTKGGPAPLPTASSTSVTTPTSTLPVAEPGESVPARLLYLESTLPVLEKTALTLRVGKEYVYGNYQAVKQQGSVFGTVTTTAAGESIELTLQWGDETVYSFSGVYDAGTGALRGEGKLSGEEVNKPVTFTAFMPKEGAIIQLKKLERQQTLRRGVSCRTSIEYPIIQASAFLPAERADRMNAQIRSFLGETATTTIMTQLDQTQAECIEMQREEIPGFSTPEGEEPSGSQQYEYETTTLVNRNDRGILSLVYATYYFTGGAHPNHFSTSQAFDLATGEQLKLTDLVRSDALATWIQREQKELLRGEYGEEALFEPEIAKQLAAGTLKGNAASSTAAYTSLDQWYLTGNTLMRYYQPYEISPYAAGMPVVELPFALWKDLAAPGVERWFR